MLMPPRTMGMEAVSVVFICHGASPPLGFEFESMASVSTALITMLTNTFSESWGDGSLKKSMPRGIRADAHVGQRRAALEPAAIEDAFFREGVVAGRPLVHRALVLHVRVRTVKESALAGADRIDGDKAAALHVRLVLVSHSERDLDVVGRAGRVRAEEVVSCLVGRLVGEVSVLLVDRNKAK
eukprot:2726179-Rhodomonas_salina.1